MKTRMMIASATALAMLSGTAMAAAPNPAASLSVGKSVRAAAPTKRNSKLTHSGAIVVGVLAAGAIVGGIIAVTNDDNNSDSN